MKRAIAILLLAVITIAAAGCSREPVTIYETEQLKIDRCGAVTTITDKSEGREYTLQAVKVKQPKGTPATVKPIADTDTITIEAGSGLLIVTDKTTGKTVYISRRHR